MPRYRVELHPDAVEDAQGVYDLIFKDSPKSAREFGEAFDAAILELEESAHAWNAKSLVKSCSANDKLFGFTSNLNACTDGVSTSSEFVVIAKMPADAVE